MYKPSVHLELNLRPFMKCVWSFCLPPKPIYRMYSELNNPIIKQCTFYGFQRKFVL